MINSWLQVNYKNEKNQFVAEEIFSIILDPLQDEGDCQAYLGMIGKKDVVEAPAYFNDS